MSTATVQPSTLTKEEAEKIITQSLEKHVKPLDTRVETMQKTMARRLTRSPFKLAGVAALVLTNLYLLAELHPKQCVKIKDNAILWFLNILGSSKNKEEPAKNDETTGAPESDNIQYSIIRPNETDETDKEE